MQNLNAFREFRLIWNSLSRLFHISGLWLAVCARLANRAVMSRFAAKVEALAEKVVSHNSASKSSW